MLADRNGRMLLGAFALELAPLVWVGGFLCLKWLHATQISARSIDFVEQAAQGAGFAFEPLGAALGVLLPLLAMAMILPRLWRYGVLLLLDVAASTLVLVDLLHLTFYNSMPSLLESVGLRQLYEIRASILDLLSPVHALYYLDAVLLLAFAPFYLRVARGVPALTGVQRALAGTAGLLLAAVLAAPAARDVVSARAWSDGQRLREISATAGILPYHLADLYLYLADEGEAGEAERRRALEYLQWHRDQAVRAAASVGAAKGANLILISAESLMTFPLGLVVEGQRITPRLDEFAAESLYFLNFHDQTGIGNTTDAEFMALQSLHPLPLSAISVTHPGNRFRALPSLLAAAGYVTVSAAGEPAWFWRMRAMHRRFGFQESWFAESFDLSEKIGSWLSDASFFRQVASRLIERPKPFMAYLLSSSNHHPFTLPAHLKQLRLGRLEGRPLGAYLHSVHYFDQAFGAFVEALRGAGLLDNTVLALYGDHAAFLGNDAQPGLDELLRLPGGARFRYLRAYKRIPLIIRLPGGQPRGRIESVGGHMDIAPTLLSLLGLEDTSGVMLGRDLLAEASRLVVFRDGSFVTDRAYYSRRFGRTFTTRCYSVANGEALDCATLEEARKEAQARLAASDAIIRGDMIPEIAARVRKQ